MRVRALLETRLTVASGIVLAVLTAAAVQGIGSWLPIEANLRHVEDPRSAPIVELRRRGEDGVLEVHIVVKPKFRNTGFRGGRLERVDLVPVGLTPYPDSVRTSHIDRTEITSLRTSELRCEFLVTLDPRRTPPFGDKLNFTAYFYDSSGKQVHWERVAIDRVPMRR
jgi:hypothetical protein